MQVNEIQVKVHRLNRVENSETLKAFADIVLNNVIVVKGFKVINSRRGMFVSAPQEKGRDNMFYETIRCLRPEVKEKISFAIMSAYNEEAKVNV